MAGEIRANVKIAEASIEAVITRANGSIENLGVVSYYHRNPLKRAWWRVRKTLKGVFKPWAA